MLLRFLVRLSGLEKEDSQLQAVRTIARALGTEAKNPKRTSTGALELDVFAPSKADFDLFLAAVRPLANLDFSKDLNVAPPFKAETELFDEAWGYFNDERYWECHEVLEGIWKTKTGEEKILLQGIILVCAAFVHHQKDEPEVALGVMRRAIRQLGYGSEIYHGVSVPTLNARCAEILATGKCLNFKV